jgi:hypothetical protein
MTTGRTSTSTKVRFPKAKVTIAYTIAVTSCNNSSDMQMLLEGAAVLKHSVHLSSIRHSPNHSAYDYRMIAFVHDPDALACAKFLTNLEYEVKPRKSLVHLDEIRNEEYANIIKDSGCCGEKEFLKLYGYNLTDYPIVVQLDIDTLILKPLDPLFDALLQQDGSSSPAAIKPLEAKFAMWKNQNTNNQMMSVNAFFTRDYNANLIYKQARKMIPPDKIQIQGAFLVLRPNPLVLKEYIELIKTGDFVPFRGWTPQGWGGVRKGSGGSDRFQGLVSYYYSGVHPNDAVELNPCYYNQNAGNPRGNGKCTTGQENCQDCRKTNVSEIYSVHFGGCRKPWTCPYFGAKQPEPWKARGVACVKLHREWHKIRNDLESSLGIDAPRYNSLELDSSKNITSYYLGHCRKNVEAEFGYEYIPMDKSLIFKSTH